MMDREQTRWQLLSLLDRVLQHACHAPRDPVDNQLLRALRELAAVDEGHLLDRLRDHLRRAQ